jgi:carbon starvation protein
MTAVIATIVCLILYFLGYRFYAGFLSRKIFCLRPNTATPAHMLRDDVDYVPTRRPVLFGHHFASITGLAPMLGPAVAVIWGWIPAMAWIVFGALLIGCVHDFGALVVSMRAKGMSIGKVAESIIGHRAKTLFLLLIFFGIALAMGVFVFVIATLFTTKFYPQAVSPSALIMVLAVIMGFLIFKKNFSLTPLTIGAFLLTLIGIWVGLKSPTMGFAQNVWPKTAEWSLILLTYAFFASILPVWALLQSRDFINSLLLYLGLGLMYLGFFFLRPEFVSPPIDPRPTGAPPIFPFVFIVIACGAVSGFHSLVSSGTTAKQINKETDARFVGYGGMIGESLLGLMAVLACTAGFISKDHWHNHYMDWKSVQGLGSTVSAFIEGSARFISSLGIPFELASCFVAVVVVSFALTTLDSATRLLRYNLEEMADTFGVGHISNRYLSSLLAVCAIGFFAFYKIDGRPAGLTLWQLFGTTNQLLAGLALLVVTLYLKQRGRNYIFTLLPTIFMLIGTLVAMSLQLRNFWRSDNGILLVIGAILFGIAIWIIVEGIRSFTSRPHMAHDQLDITFRKQT